MKKTYLSIYLITDLHVNVVNQKQSLQADQTKPEKLPQGRVKRSKHILTFVAYYLIN